MNKWFHERGQEFVRRCALTKDEWHWPFANTARHHHTKTQLRHTFQRNILSSTYLQRLCI